jgi:hypothetical protein
MPITRLKATNLEEVNPLDTHPQVTAPDNMSEDEQALFEIVCNYLKLTPNPTQAQVVAFANSLGLDPRDMQVFFCSILGPAADDEMQNSIRDADLRGDPGLNKPGDLDSFSYENINPYGRTSLEDIESPLSKLGKSIQDKFKPAPVEYVPGPTYPAIQPGTAPVPPAPVPALSLQDTPAPSQKIVGLETLLASSTDEEETVDLTVSARVLSSGSKAAFTTEGTIPFLEPMGYLDDEKAAPVLSEFAPDNADTGDDDGALSMPTADDAEQSLVNDDGAPSMDNEGKTSPSLADDNSFLNDDGLG